MMASNKFNGFNQSTEIGGSSSPLCFSWIKNMIKGNETTLKDLNDLFTWRNLGAIIFITLHMFVGFIGNFLVIWIFSRKFKRSNYRTYIIWLSSMDIANCCIGMPFLLLYHTHYLTFPSVVFCKLGRFTILFTTAASAFLLVVIALDRYIHICRPCNFKISKTCRRVLLISAVVLAAGLSWPVVLQFGKYSVTTLPYNITGTSCWLDDSYRDCMRSSNIVWSVISFAITIFLFLSYSLIVRFIYKHKLVDKRRHTRKTTLILLAVTVVFVLSALPYNIIVFVLLRKPTLHCHMTFYEGFVIYTFAWSILFANAVNPFIYGFSDTKFRKALKVLCFKKNDNQSVDTSSTERK